MNRKSTSWRSLMPLARVAAAALLLAVLVAMPALADEAAPDVDSATGEKEPGPIVVALLITGLCLGVGGAIALLRVILPGVTQAADASAERLGTRRLMLGGVLPMLGVALIGAALGQANNPVLGGVYALVLVLPLGLALLAGAVGGIPRIGARLLKDGAEAGELKRCLVGAVVLGLSALTLVIPPLGALVMFLATAWLVGIGVGAVIREKQAPLA